MLPVAFRHVSRLAVTRLLKTSQPWRMFTAVFRMGDLPKFIRGEAFSGFYNIKLKPDPWIKQYGVLSWIQNVLFCDGASESKNAGPRPEINVSR